MTGEGWGGGLASLGMTSGLELHDLIPQAGILLPVGGPDLLLRHLAEGIDVGFDDNHALGFELPLGRGEVIDRFGQLAALALRLAAGVEHPLLMRIAEPFPHFAA